jgi:CheY-like chemotaxis protein
MLTILIVDDDSDIRALVCLLLTRFGYTTLEAADGLEAEALAVQAQPDLILLDIMMAVQDGYTTCTHLRACGYTGQIALMSALPEQQGIQLAQKCGADAYIGKPLQGVRLRSLVRDVLQLP